MGRKGSRYSVEEKLFYVGLVRDDGMSTKAVERIHGVRHDQVKQWLERYEANGVDGLKTKRTQRKYSQELKLEVVQKYLAGNTSYPQLAKEYSIPNHGVIVQ